MLRRRGRVAGRRRGIVRARLPVLWAGGCVVRTSDVRRWGGRVARRCGRIFRWGRRVAGRCRRVVRWGGRIVRARRGVGRCDGSKITPYAYARSVSVSLANNFRPIRLLFIVDFWEGKILHIYCSHFSTIGHLQISFWPFLAASVVGRGLNASSLVRTVCS